MTASRAMALCATLLLLVLTTPLGDLLGLLRRLRVPPLLLDLMVLAYRMQAVLGEAWADGLTAQRARLGHGTRRQALRSMARLVSCMAVQVWARASALQSAADARNDSGELRFLTPQWAQSGRHHAVALLGGLALVTAVLAARAGGAA
jgi:cobalt/nickel transport system permease protein